MADTLHTLQLDKWANVSDTLEAQLHLKAIHNASTNPQIACVPDSAQS